MRPLLRRQIERRRGRDVAFCVRLSLQRNARGFRLARRLARLQRSDIALYIRSAVTDKAADPNERGAFASNPVLLQSATGASSELLDLEIIKQLIQHRYSLGNAPPQSDARDRSLPMPEKGAPKLAQYFNFGANFGANFRANFRA
jgi:hypothetical protein